MKKLFFPLLLIVISVVLYALTLRGVPGNPNLDIHKEGLDTPTKPFELSPERDRYLLTVVLAENHSFSIPKAVADANYSDIGYYNGKYYILFAPGISILALPFYLVGKAVNLAQVASFSMSALFAILTMVFLYKISRSIFTFPRWLSFFISFIYGFGTTSWSYAITLYQHEVTAFLIVSGFYAAWKFKQKTKLSFLYAAYVWLAYGYAIFIDYPNAVLLLPIMVYLLISSTAIEKVKDKLKFKIRLSYVLTSIVFILLVGLHGYYNYTQFGSATRVSGSLVSYKTIKDHNLLNKKNGLSQLKQLEQKKQPIGFFQENNIPFSFGELSIAPDKGIFVFVPIFILAVLGIFIATSSFSIEIAVLFGVIFLDFLLYSSWDDPWGGWAYGPRYLIPAMAIGALFIGLFLQKIRFKLTSRIIVLVLFAISSAIALLGALTTNAVPPKVEADALHTQFGILRAFSFLLKNESSSYMYNTFLSSHISLINLYWIIFAFLLLIALGVLFIPFKKRYEY